MRIVMFDWNLPWYDYHALVLNVLVPTYVRLDGLIDWWYGGLTDHSMILFVGLGRQNRPGTGPVALLCGAAYRSISQHLAAHAERERGSCFGESRLRIRGQESAGRGKAKGT